MSAANYPDTMTTAQPPEQPRPKFGFRWFIGATAAAAVSIYVFGAAYRTGNWVLVAALWAALLTCGVVSYRSFAKRERRRREAEQLVGESDAAAGV